MSTAENTIVCTYSRRHCIYIVSIIQYWEGTSHRVLISVLLYSDLKTLDGLFLMLPEEVLQNRTSAKDFLKVAFQPPIDAVDALSGMRRKAPATVTVNIRGRTVAYATLWDERQLYHAPSEWTNVWPGVPYNNNDGGSEGFEGEYAVTKSSCPIVMIDEDQ